MGNLCGVPMAKAQSSSSSGVAYGGPRGAGAQLQHGCIDTTTTPAPAASAGTQQSRTPHQQHNPHAGQQGGAAGQPSISSSTTTTTTTRETRENEKGDGLMPLGQPAIHEDHPLPRHQNHTDHDDSSPPQTIPLNWTKGKLIGAGAFGRVFQGLDDDTGQIVAVKQVALTKDETLKGRVAEHVRALEAEVAVLLQLNHRNIVRYLGTERTEDTLNIFLEYVPGGSIASMIDKFGPLKTSVIRMYAQQILKGLEYLHQKKIMHRDIKGANILVDGRGIVKLADFGASKKIENLATVGSGSKSIRGTPYWMAPEVIKQTGHGRPADIWSLACVVIEMATGKPPWSNCHTQVAAMFHIASTKEPPPLPEHLPPEAKDFLLLCFNRVPKERPNATKLLRHPWMAGTSTQPSPIKVPAPARPLPAPQHEAPRAAEQQKQQQPYAPAASSQHPAQPSESQIGLEGCGSTTGPHGLPPLVPGARGSTQAPHSHFQPLQMPQSNQQLQQRPPPPQQAQALKQQQEQVQSQKHTPQHQVPAPLNGVPASTAQPLRAGPTSAHTAADKNAGPPPQAPPALQTKQQVPRSTPPPSAHQQQQEQQQQPRSAAPTSAGTQQHTHANSTPDSTDVHWPTHGRAPSAVDPENTHGRAPAALDPANTHVPAHARAPSAPSAACTANMDGFSHTRTPSGAVTFGAGRGVQNLPGPMAVVGLAQQRTAAPMPSTARSASPLKGAQLRGLPVPRPSLHMFPQAARKHQPQIVPQQPQQAQQPVLPQQPQQQLPNKAAPAPVRPQPYPNQQQQLRQARLTPSAAMMSTDFNPMEEPGWGVGKHNGDQGTGLQQQHQLEQQQSSDVHPPPSARRPLATATGSAHTGAAGLAMGGTGLGSTQHLQQPRRQAYQGGTAPAPGIHTIHFDQPYTQERDSAPVRDSKMQNWRDGLIKEMASKRQGGFRPSSAAPATS